MSKLDHTLKSTITTNGAKTISGCTVGKPVFIVYRPVVTVSGGAEYIQIKFTSNCSNATSEGGWFCMTTDYGDMESPNVCVAIPTATSIGFKLEQVDGADEVQVFV